MNIHDDLRPWRQSVCVNLCVCQVVKSLRPVPVQLFEDTLRHSTTYRDVFRLFHRLGDTLTDEEIDDVIDSLHTAAYDAMTYFWLPAVGPMTRTRHVIARDRPEVESAGRQGTGTNLTYTA